MFTYMPAVFAVGDRYQILTLTDEPCLCCVKVGNEVYYDESNGILKSSEDLHRVEVPQAALDAAGSYTVCPRPMHKRRAYFSQTGEEVCRSFTFHPVPHGTFRAYHISDAHNRLAEPIRAAQAFGRIDLLILNGDLLSHCDEPEEFSKIYALCEAVTGGTIPIVFARGNHDMRGLFAEHFARFVPNDRGNTYYSFRVGSLWGVILDCGEDKWDDHAEYGHTVACHALRLRQKRMLEEILRRPDEEFAAPDVTHRVILCHMPFTRKNEEPFDIEEELYAQWTELVSRMQPHVMICGHTHSLGVHAVDGDWDDLGQPCPVVSGGMPFEGGFASCGYTFSPDGIRIAFTDSDGCIFGEQKL